MAKDTKKDSKSGGDLTPQKTMIPLIIKCLVTCVILYLLALITGHIMSDIGIGAGSGGTEVRVGDVSNKVYIWGKQIRVYPNEEGVKYILFNTHGKIVPWTGPAKDWKDLDIEYIQIKPTTRNITYSVKPWKN